ncbi:MAG TPA: hypothetical protein VN786_04400 [Acidimicrobiales bacterium]|nr:hypothetical protein [Acidimicrobiales bacterium]
MRLVVEVKRSEDGGIEGQTQAPGGPPLPFSGRLELLRGIDDALAAEGAAPAPGLAGQEERE